MVVEHVNYSLDRFKQSQNIVLRRHCLPVCTRLELTLEKFGALTMDQRVRFLKVLIEYPVTFDVDINLSVENHLKQSCIIVFSCSRHRDLKALRVFDRQSYVAAVFVLFPNILCNSLGCSNVFFGLPDFTAVKDVTFYIIRFPFKLL